MSVSSTKKLIALTLCVMMVFSLFAGCKKTGEDDTSSVEAISTIQLPDDINVADLKPGEAVDLEIPDGDTYDDLITYFEDANQSGDIALKDGETLKLFDIDGVTEITDYKAFLGTNMIAVKYGADGQELYRFRLVVIAVDAATGEASVVEAASSTGAWESGQGEQGSGDNTDSTAATTSDGTTSVEIPAEPVTITIWEKEQNSALSAAIAAYTKEHPNVTIKLSAPTGESSGQHTTLTTLKTAIKGGTAPTIVNMDQVYLAAAGESGYLKNLAAYGANNIKGKFITSCWNSVCDLTGNKVFGLPFDANTICFTYNMDLFSAAGASVPTNYAEMKTAAQKLKAKYPSYYAYTTAFGWQDKNWSCFQYLFWLWRCGGEVLNSDNTAAAFNGTAGQEALQMLVDMKNDGYAAPSWYETQFYAGEVGMMDIGSWSYKSTFGTDAKANFGADLMPELKSGVSRYSGLGLYALGITSTATEEQAVVAYDFLAYYCGSSVYQLSYAEGSNLMPSLVGALTNSYYSQGAWPKYRQQLQFAKARPGVACWDSIEGYIADAVSLAANGEKGVVEALDAAATSTNKKLDRLK